MDTGETQQLSQDGPTDEWPTWSPDGQRIAFVSTRDSAQGAIYVTNADGSDVDAASTINELADAMLSGRRAGVDRGGAWSLDGVGEHAGRLAAE